MKYQILNSMNQVVDGSNDLDEARQKLRSNKDPHAYIQHSDEACKEYKEDHDHES